MADKYSRRKFLGTITAAVAIDAAAGSVGAAQPQKSGKTRIIGIACSPRKGKTTAASLRVCLDAAAQTDPAIETELIELAGMKIDGSLAAGLPLEPGQKDDFPQLIPNLSDPSIGGIIIGTPVYFNNMTSLCKAFIERCMVFYKNSALKNKAAGILAVGSSRNGGQELTIQSVQAALFCQEMVIVGAAKPNRRIGATVWNKDGDVTKDEFGMATAKNLGQRVARVALQLKAAATYQ